MGSILKIAFIVAASGFFLWLILYFAWLAIRPEKSFKTEPDLSAGSTKKTRKPLQEKQI